MSTAKHNLSTHLKEKLKEKRKAMQELKDQTYALREEIEKVFWSEIQEAAKHGDIAINRKIAEFFSRYRLTFTDGEEEQLQQYIKDCKEYQELQRRFAKFYKSDAFSRICNYFASGEKECGYWNANRPRTVNSDYRPYRY